MINSTDKEVVRFAGIQIGLLYVNQKAPEEFLQKCLTDDGDLIKGFTEAITNNLDIDNNLLMDMIIRLADNANKDVRQKTNWIFHKILVKDIEKCINFIEKFLTTLAFKEDSHNIIDLLKKSNHLTTKIPNFIIKVCLEVLTNIEKGDSKSFYSMNVIFEMICKIYEEAESSQDQINNYLDIIDRIIRLNSYVTDEVLKKFERR